MDNEKKPALRESAGTVAIPVLRHPVANSWYRVRLPWFPAACPVCGCAVAEVWQDHHLAHAIGRGDWMCQGNRDGQDCSRFVFMHDEDVTKSIGSVVAPCEIIFNCQKTRSLNVGGICQQVLAARRAIAPKEIENA